VRGEPDHVLILCEYATASGGERSMLSALDGVRRAGIRISVAAPPTGPLADRLRAKDVEVVPFETLGHGGRKQTQDALRGRLRELLLQRRPGLVHPNSLSMSRLAGPVAAELGIPSIGHLRDIIRLSRQAVADLNCHTRLLAVSEATRAYHVAAGLSSEKTHVLYNGVDLAEFRPRKATGRLHRELGIEPGAGLVAAIGQIGIRKGLDVLARAAVMLKNELPEVHYLFVGERWSDKAEARRFEADLRSVAANELPGRMHFLGYRDDVPQLLSELAILVHPSRQEPLGRVLLEAAASGVAVVTTGVGGTPEIFPPGSGTAILVPPDEPDALAAAMQQLLRDESLRCQMASAARRRAEEEFDVTVAAANIVHHYRQVCHATSAVAPRSPTRGATSSCDKRIHF
jgi:glycosyltransferase involved in cell wall biosynthesis